MIQSYDVGSLPFFGNMDEFATGARSFEVGVVDKAANYFEQSVVRVFLDKLAAGLDVPNFPQFRDMSDMFLSMFEGVERLREGYVETARLTLKPNACCLPEISAIKKNARLIGEKLGKPLIMKVCVTGPYTLASFFPYRTSETFSRLGNVLSQIIAANVFSEKNGCVGIVSVDEPLFGLVDDALLDCGSSGRENLLKAWSDVFHSAKSRNVRTCLHLHNTSDDLFWTVTDLDVIESHVDDPLYTSNETKKRLDAEDKVLKASACVTDFDKLIRENVTANSAQRNELAANEAVADAWRKIHKGLIAPEGFVETVDTMRRNVKQNVERFGPDRVPFAGPECGLRGFPTYASAIECLRRVAEAARTLS